jgi:1,2-diacylglycerol 3-alpha-glucosyltransferase
MKVAMFADSFHPTVDGAVVAMDIASAGLERRGHEVIVIAPDVSPRPKVPRKVHYLPAAQFRGYSGYRVAIAPSDMLEFLRNEKVDVIHCHGLASMAILSLTAARALKIPHVLTFHTLAHEAMRHYSPLMMRKDFMDTLVWIYLRNLLKRPEVVIAPSSPIRDELVANRVAMKACEIVPTGVDCSKFTPDRYDKKFLEKYGLLGKRVLLHVGRLSTEKRLDVVLNALAKLAPSDNDMRLLVVGKGPSEGYYRRMTEDLGIADRVIFAGFLPDDDLATAYASSELLVIASTFETQGLVVLEALASGTPVVGIRCRAIPEFVKEGKNGCLFEEDTCADAIQRCFLRSESMMMSAVSSAREFSVDTCTAKLEKVYKQAGDILATLL